MSTQPSDRTDYKCDAGIARWWAKDGAWHIAVHLSGREGLFWTAAQYKTRDEAITALREVAP